MTYKHFVELKKAGKLIWDADYCAYYYPEWGEYYNKAGQALRHKDEYNTQSEGYTPFGDE